MAPCVVSAYVFGKDRWPNWNVRQALALSVEAFGEAPREFTVVEALATPCQALGEGIDLIVMAPGKRQQFSGEFLKPSGAPGKTNRAPGKQVGLRNHASPLVGVGLVGRDIDRLLAQALDQAAADRGRPRSEVWRGHSAA